MKKYRLLAAAIALVFALAATLASCGGDDNGNGNNNDEEYWARGDGSGVEAFHLSEGLDENGFFVGVTARDFVEPFDFSRLSVPSYVHTISDEEVQEAINELLSMYAYTAQITNRAVRLGDSVNIDFVGYLSGTEPFAGGSSGGAGHPLTIGSGQFIPGFEEQLIGAMPGEVVNVELAFPEHYPQAPHLAGVDVVFVTTVNFISEQTVPEITDDFVAGNLYEQFGWATVAQTEEGVAELLRHHAVSRFIGDVVFNLNVISIPQQVMEYFERVMLEDYRRWAEANGMSMEQVFSIYGVLTVGGFLIELHDEIRETAEAYLVLQAIAESVGIIAISDEELSDSLAENFGIGDYSVFVEMYGLPYIKKMVRSNMVFNFIYENAVFE